MSTSCSQKTSSELLEESNEAMQDLFFVKTLEALESVGMETKDLDAFVIRYRAGIGFDIQTVYLPRDFCH